MWYRLLLEKSDPELAMENFRNCLKCINSEENHHTFLHSGFPVLIRDENRTIEEPLSLVERAFGLQKQIHFGDL